jgi:mannose-1-phosphate guanylyltransferase/mannose-1-phosphate guanylyltransferase/mannose-6-phosphate isomerase
MDAPTKHQRPWGYYEILSSDGMTQVKRIVIHDQQQLSYQSHAQRDEYWFCYDGYGLITIDGEEREFLAGSTIQVMRGEKHRAKSLHGDLKFIEVQVGNYLGEDDIVRYEDNYGRKSIEG